MKIIVMNSTYIRTYYGMEKGGRAILKECFGVKRRAA